MRIPRCILPGIFLLLVQACGDEKTTEQNRDRPNVIIILTDDQGFGDVGFHGHPELKTPHLDRLARHAPLVLGASRKGILGRLTGVEDPAHRDLATAVTTALGFASFSS